MSAMTIATHARRTVAAVVIAAASLAALTGSPVTAERTHCDARVASESTWRSPQGIPLYYAPVIYKNTLFGYLSVAEGTKVRFDGRTEGFDLFFSPPLSVGTMYRVSRIVGPAMSTDGIESMWLDPDDGIVLTAQFERCAAQLPVLAG
jgi:hypothetical protein